MSHITSCLFDIGGVVVRSPMIAISNYEEQHSLPNGYINYAISASGPHGAWQKLERGEITLDKGFYNSFTTDLNNVKHWHSFHGRLGCIPPDNMLSIHGETLFWSMMSKAREFDPLVINAIAALHDSGKFKIGALTNDFQYPKNHLYAENSALRSLFDVFISSSEEGMRKPEHAFYKLAMERLGVNNPHEVVFLDDIGQNLRAARQVGFKTIKVDLGQSEKAIRELEKITNVCLIFSGVNCKL